MEIAAQALGKNSSMYLDLAYELSQVYYKFGQYPNAKKEVTVVFKARQKEKKEKPHEYVQILSYLGDIYSLMKDYDDALNCYRIALEV